VCLHPVHIVIRTQRPPFVFEKSFSTKKFTRICIAISNWCLQAAVLPILSSSKPKVETPLISFRALLITSEDSCILSSLLLSSLPPLSRIVTLLHLPFFKPIVQSILKKRERRSYIFTKAYRFSTEYSTQMASSQKSFHQRLTGVCPETLSADLLRAINTPKSKPKFSLDFSKLAPHPPPPPPSPVAPYQVRT
jgi:hypothetical protein